jgi:adenylate cyclase
MGRLGEVPGVTEVEAGASPTAPDRDAVLGQLERILSSVDFDASPRSRAFFSFVVEETIHGRQEELSQSVIATRVFGRRADFDPTVDPIVRIQAGRLRRSLERYYLLSGARDRVRIELPRGSYVPVARWGQKGEPRPEPRRGPAVHDPDGWPTLVVSRFEAERAGGELDAAAAQLESELCVEMGRHGDVRVVRLPDREALGLGHGDFELSGRVSDDAAGLRVSARLLDNRDASQVWAEEYAAPANGAGGFPEEVARRIAARVASEQGVVARQLWADERLRPASELSPYGAILRSYRFFFTRDVADFAPACESLERIVRERPDCALAFVQLARLYVADHAFELAPAAREIDDAIALAQTGVRLEPESRRPRVALAGALLMKGELAATRAEAEAAYALQPESLVYLEWIGWLLAFAGEWERGIALIRRTFDRNPNHIPATAHALWAYYLHVRDYEAAYQSALLYRDPTFFWRALMRACCLGHLGRFDEAQLEVAELLRRKPDFPRRGRVLIGRYVKFPDLLERVVAGLGKAGLRID